MPNDPQVPWTDEQWARVNQVIQEEAARARVAATFLPLIGPLSPDTDFVRANGISYADAYPLRRTALAKIKAAEEARDAAMQLTPPNLDAALVEQGIIANTRSLLGKGHITIDDKKTIKLATLQVIVPVRNAQRADGRSRDGERAGLVPPRGQRARSP